MASGDEAKGRAKEAFGKLTDDKEMESEGKIDRATGKAKKAADTAREKSQELRDKLTDGEDDDEEQQN